MTEVYLDNNATTEPSPTVREAVSAALGSHGFGNASSPTPPGQRARALIEHARDSVGRLVGSDPMQVLFTSGCTEGNNTVLRLALSGPRRLIISDTEHATVAEVATWLETLGVEVVRLRGLDGRIDPFDLATALETPASLVSIQWVNSETGVLQPVAELADVCRRVGVPLHVDAAQAVGREEVDFDALGLDYLTFSGHKLHAPQGVGALIARDPGTLPRLLRGGDQERGQRAGTENLPGISGLSAACADRAGALAAAVAHMRSLRDRFESALLMAVPEARINAASSPRVCNTSNVRFPIDGQALMAQLTAAGVICSQTSACSSRAPEPSKVLTAIGLSRDEAYSSVRFSFSVMNTDQDVDVAVDAAASVCRCLAELGTI